MKPLTKTTSIFDRIVNLLAGLSGAILIFLMLLMSTEVVMRRLGISQLWVFEVCEYTLLYMTFLGTAWVLKSEGHVVIDVVINRLNPRNTTLLNIITSILGAIMCLIVTYYSASTSWWLLRTGYTLKSAIQPPIFPIIVIIPIGTLLLFIQFLRRTRGYLGKYRGLLDK